VKAIPTVYASTTFRSRLEASWAKNFDKIRLPWHYEPEGFALSDGTNYLPDFYLPTARAWVEVKGVHNERMDKVEQFAADLWAESEATDTYHTDAPMVLLVRAPDRPKSPAPWPLNLLGYGKMGSAAFAVCDECYATTAVSLWQPLCRNCGHKRKDGLDWMKSAHRLTFNVTFQYLASGYRQVLR
jgi:hypothetical protein